MGPSGRGRRGWNVKGRRNGEGRGKIVKKRGDKE